VRRYPCDACIVTEPSEGKLILAHKGFVWVEIETAGVAAHGSRWQDGVSAVASMGRIIAAIDAFDRNVLRVDAHPLLGPASMHCAMVTGGDGWSTYAPMCTLRVERRTLPGESPEGVLEELRGIIAGIGEEAVVREMLSRSPLECAPDSRIAQAVSSAAADDAGPPGIGGVAYWMDAAIFADAGAETVDYGPTGGGAHGAVEWVDLESVVRCTRVLIGAAHGFLSA
jgi:acetylornithine deacetylase